MSRPTRGMRAYWDDAARRNAVWYVDTSLSFHHPDMERFFETGRVIVDQALTGSPVEAPGTGLAVEIGSGLGRLCQGLAPHFDEVVGIDVSPEMVRRAEELASDPRISFQVGSGDGLEQLADASADLVLSFTVFQHIPSVAIIEKYIAESGRVLRPGGVFIFQWNNQAGMRRWQLRRAALGLLQKTRLRPERHRRHAPEFLGSAVPLSIIERAVHSGGMQLVRTQGLGELFAWAWAQKTG